MQKILSPLVTGGVLLSAIFGASNPSASLPKQPENQTPQIVQASARNNPAQVLANAFFGKNTPPEMINRIVAAEEQFVSSRPAFPASLNLIQNYSDTIAQTADKYGIPREVAIGIGLLENGGSVTATSKAGAVGIYQLMPYTARNLGLTVNNKVDERKNPVKNIDAGMRYLAQNYQSFGDWGLATWAYHAGAGNVTRAIKLYAKNQNNVDLSGLSDVPQMKNYIAQSGLTVNDVLSDSAVKTFTQRLKDDSSAYSYKVIATADLFHKAETEAS